ncbi:MAG: 4Fe-4S dicluster domain-containing protein [Planctomycetota bacterium]
MAKRLFIDMFQCDMCEECTVRCDYMYQSTVTDHGLRDLREAVTFQIICRRCENPSCVAACRFQALERQADGVIRRHNMRCVSCKCCSHACPFGTIYPELTLFYAVRCDYCLGRLETGDARCLSTCARKAVSWREVEENPKEQIYVVHERLAVRAPKWDKRSV